VEAVENLEGVDEAEGFDLVVDLEGAQVGDLLRLIH